MLTECGTSAILIKFGLFYEKDLINLKVGFEQAQTTNKEKLHYGND